MSVKPSLKQWLITYMRASPNDSLRNCWESRLRCAGDHGGLLLNFHLKRKFSGIVKFAKNHAHIIHWLCFICNILPIPVKSQLQLNFVARCCYAEACAAVNNNLILNLKKRNKCLSTTLFTDCFDISNTDINNTCNSAQFYAANNKAAESTTTFWHIPTPWKSLNALPKLRMCGGKKRKRTPLLKLNFYLPAILVYYPNTCFLSGNLSSTSKAAWPDNLGWTSG